MYIPLIIVVGIRAKSRAVIREVCMSMEEIC